MKLKIAQFVTLMLFLLVVGVFWGTWFSLSRSISAITPATFLEIGKAIIENLAGPMRILMPAAVLSCIVSLILLPDKRSAAFYWTSLGGVLMIVSLVITLTVNVPIDNQIRLWTTVSLPSNWEQLRDRWETCHAARTFASLAGFASILVGTLASKRVHEGSLRRRV